MRPQHNSSMSKNINLTRNGWIPNRKKKWGREHPPPLLEESVTQVSSRNQWRTMFLGHWPLRTESVLRKGNVICMYNFYRFLMGHSVRFLHDPEFGFIPTGKNRYLVRWHLLHRWRIITINFFVYCQLQRNTLQETLSFNYCCYFDTILSYCYFKVSERGNVLQK